ncbi:MAG: Asp-tRNA(Asn)/Glu-tRNA(Gln) amidotransferase subunit GatC [Phycisphaerae bacterium]|jgi:aspartyl-tRNA(Asn)/glutamyl-tRNA(Gln) amidotransferase subunit C|nr:Asp-tRNA(Asn)/Glu-tRNA(Gln) amidotransferase subunit GatC [Phycisphaerae bacterium]
MNENASETTLTDEAVAHVAHLSRLALTPEDVTKAKDDLTAIFTHIDRLRSIATQDVEPLDHPTELKNHIRSDDVGNSLSQEQVLANAPAVKDVYFDVPKVLSESS